MASKLKWTKQNRTDRARFEQAHSWPFTFPNSDVDAYTAGYEAIDWSDGTSSSDASSSTCDSSSSSGCDSGE